MKQTGLSIRSILLSFLWFVLIVFAPSAWTQADIEDRKVSMVSEGVRITGTVYHLKSSADQKLPAIIMSHGWGGTAALLRTQAVDMARAGYFVIAFDYRGWGDSNARLLDTASGNARPNGTKFKTEVSEVREVVDPLDQADDIFNVIHWAVGEPMVDSNRIGLWGTSFSGGLVVYVAAREPRIKALVSQVGYMGVSMDRTGGPELTRAREEGTKRARGELPYPAPGAREVGNLRGAPIREKFLRYAPVEDAARVKNCAMLFIAAENEELFSNRDHPERAAKNAPEPKKYVVIPNISHYGIYSSARIQATQLAIDWFDAHLK